MALPPRLYALYEGIWRPLFAPFASGTNVFERDWDLLVVLDGCRVDALREVADEYDFLDEVGSVRSVGSQSKEWLARTFTPEYEDQIASTAYVTANVFTDEVFGESTNDRRTNPANWTTLDRDRLGDLVELWRSDWDDEVNVVPPEGVTDATISVARDGSFDRVVAHYMQPHEPFIAGDEPIRDVWPKLQQGDLDEERARSAYRDNLRLVLDSVERLLENVDAPETVITADHGNAFGEWGIYGHPIGFPHPVVKKVPWARTEAVDRRTHTPEWEGETDDASEDVAARLEALGYR